MKALAGAYQGAQSFMSKKGIKNPKLVLGIGGVVIAGIVVFFVARAIKRRRDAKVTSASTQKDMTEELSDLSIGQTTLSKGDAIIIAQNLLNAMDRWGTDEAAIIDNLNRCQTKGDLELVIQTFGIKPKSSTGLADTFMERWIEAVMKNLNGWLRDELSGSDLRKVKEIYDRLGVPF